MEILKEPYAGEKSRTILLIAWIVITFFAKNILSQSLDSFSFYTQISKAFMQSLKAL